MYIRTKRKVSYPDELNMSLKKFIYAGFIIIFFSAFVTERKTEPRIYRIPTQTFNPWKVLMWPKGNDTITVDSFSVTEFITLREYKEFLAVMRRDSGETCYKSLLPDSAICTPELYTEYLSNASYEAFPVCGISWVNACRYCDWRSLKEAGSDTLRYIYRLPYINEWLSAFSYFAAKHIPNDMNCNYSDWVLEAMDEMPYEFVEKRGALLRTSHLYPDNPLDYPVLRRKRFIGNSFRLQHHVLLDFLYEYAYSYEGYAYISFRAVRVKSDQLYKWKWVSVVKKSNK